MLGLVIRTSTRSFAEELTSSSSPPGL